MSRKADNGHHDLMDQMNGLNDGTRRENDFLAGVDALAAKQEPTPTDHNLPVGQRVRALREHRGLSLGDLAMRTGLSEAALAEIESETASPPLGVLIKLGKALDMQLGTLIASGEDTPYTVVRVAERQQMSRYASQKGTSYGYSYETLAPKKKNRTMEPFIVTLHPTDEEVEPSTHDGEEFIFILDGQMEALVGDAVEILEPGDAIYYDSTVPHLVRPHGTKPAKILAVIYSHGK